MVQKFWYYAYLKIEQVNKYIDDKSQGSHF